jgi:hypothetical protein
MKTTELRDSEALFSVVTSMAGEGEPVATCGRPTANVYDLTIDNRGARYTGLPLAKIRVIYSCFPDTGEIQMDFAETR